MLAAAIERHRADRPAALCEHALRTVVAQRPRDDVAEPAAGDQGRTVGRHRDRLDRTLRAAELAHPAARDVVRAQLAVAHRGDQRLAVGREREVEHPVARPPHVARGTESERLVHQADDVRAIVIGDGVELEPRERRGRILAQRRLGLHEHQLALAVLGVAPQILGALALDACDVTLGDDGAERLDADRGQRDRARDRHHDDPAVLRELLADELPRRVRVRADQLAGLEPAQILGERAAVRITIHGDARHRLRDDIDELGRRVIGDGRERRGRARDHAVEHRLRRDIGVRRPAGEQLVEYRAHRVDIGALVDDLAACLLWRHVRGRADHLARDRRHAGAGRGDEQLGRRLGDVAPRVAREAPVDDDRLAELADDHVRWLEVAVDHAFAVRVADGVGDRDQVAEQTEPLGQRRLRREQLLERAALDQLHHVVRRAVRPAPCFVDRHDAGMLEARRDQRLAHEPRLVPLILAQQLLHRDGAAEPAIDRAHDPAEAAACVLGDVLVPLGVIDRDGLRIRLLLRRRRLRRQRRLERGGAVSWICGHSYGSPTTGLAPSRFP